MMVQGGNGQIKRFFQKLGLENVPIQTLYTTKGAAHYREKLKERVQRILSGEITNAERRTSKTFAPVDNTPPIDTKKPDIASSLDEYYDASFGEGTMGMTLTKHRNRAIVSKTVSGGLAQSNGVKVGDYVIGVSGKSLEAYDDIMHSITHGIRPIVINFARYHKNSPNSPKRFDLHYSFSEASYHIDNNNRNSPLQQSTSEKLSPSKVSDATVSTSLESASSVNKQFNKSFAYIEDEHHHSNSDSEKYLRKAKSCAPTVQQCHTPPAKSPNENSRKIFRENSSEKKTSAPLLFDSTAFPTSMKTERKTVGFSSELPPMIPVSKSHSAPSDFLLNAQLNSNSNSRKQSMIASQSSSNDRDDMSSIINEIGESLNDLEKNLFNSELETFEQQPHDPILAELEISFEEKLRNIIEVRTT
jgi:uncharacterized protein (DUF697 family)